MVRLLDDLPRRAPGNTSHISYGDHACLLYEDEPQQMEAVVPFITQGLINGDQCVYIADDRSVDHMRNVLLTAGVDVEAETARGALLIITKREAYLRDGYFDPRSMVAFLNHLVNDSLAKGFAGLRITGEMTWALGPETGCNRLLEYEALLEDVFSGKRVMAVCQYNLHRFSAEFMYDVLRIHPKIMLGQEVHPNIFFEPAEHVLSGGMPEMRVRWMLERLEQQALESNESRAVQRQLDEHMRTLKFLNDIGPRFAGELSLERLVQTVTDVGVEVTGAQFGAFFYNVADRRGERYTLYTISGVPREHFSQFPLPRNTEVFHPTFHGVGVVRSDDITADPRYGKMPPHYGMPKGHLPVRSYLAAPVMGRDGEVIGGLFFGHAQPGVFSEQAEKIVEGIASQAAIAFDNARLYETLKNSEERYRDIFDSIGVSIWDEDFSEVKKAIEEMLRNGVSDMRQHLEKHPEVLEELTRLIRVTAVNRYSLQMFGAESIDALQAGFQVMARPETRRAFQEEFVAIAEGRKLVNVETRVGKLTGEDMTVILTIAFPEEENEWRSVPVCLVDVSAQKKTEAALRRTENLYRAIGESINYGVWVCDREGRNIYASASFLDLLGLTQEECSDLGWGNSLDPEQREEIIQGWKDTVAHGDYWEREMRFLGKDGNIHHLLVRGLPIVENGEVTCWAGISLDIENLKQTERALRKSEKRLRELNETLEKRVEERTEQLQRQTRQLQMLANALTEAEQQERRKLAQILHDGLQQTLVAIKMQLHSPNARAGNFERIESLVAETIDAARTLARELSPPVLHDSRLPKALEWLVRRFGDVHQFSVHVDTDADFPVLRENAKVFLFNAVRELLLNAVKHSGVREAIVRLAAEDNDVRIEVSDHGHGFDPTELDEANEIRGLGLFSIRQRLEALGGGMEIVSAPGRGARFILTLPEAAQEIQESRNIPAHAAASPSPDGKSKSSTRLLVTDDHRIVREGFIAMLRTDDAIEVVGEASNGMEAIELAHRLQPDIIIMDINMPVLDGIEATRQIKQRFPQIHVVGLSLHEEKDKAQAMREAGASAYLQKDGPSETLFQTIHTLAAAESKQEDSRLAVAD